MNKIDCLDYSEYMQFQIEKLVQTYDRVRSLIAAQERKRVEEVDIRNAKQWLMEGNRMNHWGRKFRITYCNSVCSKRENCLQRKRF